MLPPRSMWQGLRSGKKRNNASTPKLLLALLIVAVPSPAAVVIEAQTDPAKLAR